ncbi:hypothetical protein [Pigmentiphaga kullae]|uniref:Peptidase M28-like protein n=1 Tax=Pigmentiphaga kullae TaxID=151784 RepID=A0A4Q7NIV3_9BURK|nr:hypothetical protein [Pigmentiphaga kullae]RZS84853.1 hypothetical protein EV675_0874 [Pigmentiphaga kullae]
MKKTLLVALVTAAFLTACDGGGDGSGQPGTDRPDGEGPTASPLTSIDENLLITRAEAQEWLTEKDSYDPTYAGSETWKHYLASLETKLRSYGVVDIIQYAFGYDRWYTTEWPDKSGWSLLSDGVQVDVASYAINSGDTGVSGVTAPMVLYDMNLPAAQRPTKESLAGKIVVFKQQLYSSVASGSVGGYSSPSLGDYEFRSDEETFPAPGEKMPVEKDADYRNRQQLNNAAALGINVCQAGGAVAAVWVLDMSPLAAQGARQHSTPRIYDCPGVLVDRVAGAKVLADAAAGKMATVKLEGEIEKDSRTYQLVGFLPGRAYGTEKDQRVLLSTHTDGMSNVEDNGGLGIAAVIQYMSRVPQAQRPRTIMFFLDNRHFVPGAETGVPYDYFDDFEHAADKVVGGVALEHFGGMQFAENGNEYKATGLPAHTYAFTYPNPLAIEKAIQAVNDAGLRRGIVTAPTGNGYSGLYSKPGVHGLSQGFWFGGNFMSPLAENGHLPGWHVSGDWPSAGYQHWGPATGVRVDPEYFRINVKTALRLVQTLMTDDLTALAPDWGIVRANIDAFTDADFVAAGGAAAAKTTMLRSFDAIFANTKAGKYDLAAKDLPALRQQLANSVKAAAGKNALAALDAVIKLVGQGPNLPPA